MRIGIFGGSFDPVHLGHLVFAEQAREQALLDQVWFVPAARPPHKQGLELAPFSQRVEMLQLAIAGNAAFEVDEVERDRPGPSYTAVTLQELYGIHPDHVWFLLVGADAVRDLPGWHQPDLIVDRAQLLIMPRSGVHMPTAEQLGATLGAAARLQVINAPLIDISSTDLRHRVGKAHSVRYLVPRAVEAYIQDKKLYAGV